MVKYELRLMFEWGGSDEDIVWGMNEAAKEKFGGYDIKLDNLPISVGLKEELIRLHEWHDSSLNWEYPPDPSPWSAEEKAKFLEESVKAYTRLCDELGPECHVIYDAFDYGQIYEYVEKKIVSNSKRYPMDAIVFDIGQTLAYYPIPLNWSALYRPAFEHVEDKLNLKISEEEFEHIGATLRKYNTRINPREEEVSSDIIFKEIIGGTNLPVDLIEDIKREFYLFFRRDVVVYDEVEDTLKELRKRNIPTATLSDVAYGMDNKYALDDISEVVDLIDFPYTSNDTGYRKPNKNGLLFIASKMNVPIEKIAFVGDEKKDIECAKNAGAISVLINRTDEEKNYGQDYTIQSLTELLNL